MSSDMGPTLASSAGTAVDYSVPSLPSGQTLYTGNYIVAKVNGYRQMLTSAQYQQHVDNGDTVEVVNLP
jgi:hypothetical protein